jgi:hypothetical protein
MQGRRRDVAPDEMEPGDFGKRQVSYRGRTFDAWWYCAPIGLLGRLSMPEDVEEGRASRCHHVEEHDDGLITVLPQPGNSNSILVTGWSFDAGPRAPGEPLKSWHGYIRHGVWEAC